MKKSRLFRRGRVPQGTPAIETSPSVQPIGKTETPNEKSRRRRNKTQEYPILFFKESAANTRSGKVVYIRKEHHDRILKVVQIIGKNEVSMFSFLDNLLEHHFSTWQGELAELYESSIDKSF